MGVGLSMAKGGAIIPYPESIPGLKLWLRYNTFHTNIGDQTTASGSISDGDSIRSWGSYSTDYASNSKIRATQIEDTDCPLFEADDNTIEFSSNNRWFDLSEVIALQQFTLIMRIRLTSVSLDSLFGHSAIDFFRIQNSKSFRAKVGSSSQLNFIEDSDELAIGASAPYYVISFTRDASDECEVLVSGGDYSNKQWGGDTVTQAGEFQISNIGSSLDDAAEMGGNVKDVLIYDSYLTGSEIEDMVSFLNNQG
tara:strand:+ start:414 stop:1169 length:756 start_codon:yes stop_codon:yes gene_type:complete